MTIRAARETIPVPPPTTLVNTLDGSPLNIRLSQEHQDQLNELVRAAKQPGGVVTRASYVRALIEKEYKAWKRRR
jgi:hypothetical protein